MSSKRSAEEDGEISSDSKRQKQADSADDGTEEDLVERFQKDAIMREMQVYKKRLARAEDRVREVETEVEGHQTTLSLLNRAWQQLEQDLLTMLPLLGQSPNTTTDASQEGSFLGALLDARGQEDVITEAFQSRIDFVKQLVVQLAKTLESLSSLPEDTDLRAAYDQLQAKYHDLLNEVVQVRDSLALSEKRAEVLDSQVDDLKYDLEQAERKIERAKSRISREAFAPKSEGAPSDAQEGGADQAQATQSHQIPDAPVSPKGSQQLTPDILKIIDEHTKMSEEIDSAKAIVDLRSRELDQARKELFDLRALYDQSITLPDHVVTEHGLFKELESKCHYFKIEADTVRKSFDEVKKQLDNSRDEHRTLIQKVNEDEKARRTALEAEIQKLNDDLNRVRQVRDSMQRSLEVEKAKAKKEDEEKKDLRLLVESNRERMRCLLEDLKRVKLMVASQSGDARFYQDVLVSCDIQDSDKKELPKMKGLLESLRERAEIAERQLSESKNDADRLAGLSKQISDLETKLRHYESIFGDLTEASDGSLKAQLAQKQKLIDQLELKVKTLEMTQDGVLKEIDAISNSHTELEARLSQQSQLLASKEENLVKLAAEKLKYDQKIALVMKDRDAQSNVAIALKKQIKHDEEERKALLSDNEKKASLISALEREIVSMKSICDRHEEQAKAALNAMEGLNRKSEKVTGKHEELRRELQTKESSIKKLTEERSELASENKKLGVKVKTLERRLKQNLPSLGGNGGAGDMDADMAKDLRKLAFCSVCESRIKDHILSRCMHIFCKQCVDKRLETRQRKCPTCGSAFGPNDVKQVYF